MTTEIKIIVDTSINFLKSEFDYTADPKELLKTLSTKNNNDPLLVLLNGYTQYYNDMSIYFQKAEKMLVKFKELQKAYESCSKTNVDPKLKNMMLIRDYLDQINSPMRSNSKLIDDINDTIYINGTTEGRIRTRLQLMDIVYNHCKDHNFECTDESGIKSTQVHEIYKKQPRSQLNRYAEVYKHLQRCKIDQQNHYHIHKDFRPINN